MTAGVVISIDLKGVIEYWDESSAEFPSAADEKVAFRYKTETDLYDIAKVRIYSMHVSHSDG